MTRIRKALLSAGLAFALILSLGTAASADPGDPGGTTFSSAATTSHAHESDDDWSSSSESVDPGDPGGTD